jgi:hypothetical protein
MNFVLLLMLQHHLDQGHGVVFAKNYARQLAPVSLVHAILVAIFIEAHEWVLEGRLLHYPVFDQLKSF